MCTENEFPAPATTKLRPAGQTQLPQFAAAAWSTNDGGQVVPQWAMQEATHVGGTGLCRMRPYRVKLVRECDVLAAGLSEVLAVAGAGYWLPTETMGKAGAVYLTEKGLSASASEEALQAVAEELFLRMLGVAPAMSQQPLPQQLERGWVTGLEALVGSLAAALELAAPGNALPKAARDYLKGRPAGLGWKQPDRA